MARFLLICLGGAVGTGARYLFSTAMTRAFGNFPFGTLGVNVLGSFLTSVLMVLALEKSALAPELRLILVTGVLGGFTTYSSFAYETLVLARDADWARAAVNVLAQVMLGLGAVNIAVTLVACLAAGVAGIWVARLAG
jgi:CrcB protein